MPWTSFSTSVQAASLYINPFRCPQPGTPSQDSGYLPDPALSPFATSNSPQVLWTLHLEIPVLQPLAPSTSAQWDFLPLVSPQAHPEWPPSSQGWIPTAPLDGPPTVHERTRTPCWASKAGRDGRIVAQAAP